MIDYMPPEISFIILTSCVFSYWLSFNSNCLLTEMHARAQIIGNLILENLPYWHIGQSDIIIHISYIWSDGVLYLHIVVISRL